MGKPISFLFNWLIFFLSLFDHNTGLVSESTSQVPETRETVAESSVGAQFDVDGGCGGRLQRIVHAQILSDRLVSFDDRPSVHFVSAASDESAEQQFERIKRI